jgi:serine/threonine-protein kinase RsbW
MARAQITLTVPARPEFLRLVRLASADAGSRVGLDYEEVDDLKIAASEACSLVLGTEDPLTLVFTLEDGSVTIEGSTVAVPRDDELARALIVAVVDDYEISGTEGTTRFRVVKRHRLAHV